MKRKGLYVLVTVAMLALAAGCGSNQGEGNPQNQVTEAGTPTEAPETTTTPEPTATPLPTATPVPANYMEANGIEVLGAGWHTCKGFIANEPDEYGNPIMEIAEREYSFAVEEEDNGDGTKIIYVTMNVNPYVHEDGGQSLFAMGGFVDLHTGETFLPMDPGQEQTTLLKQEDKEYELQLTMEFEYPSVTHPYYTEWYTLVCPSDYEDAGFYMTGWNFDAEAFMERAGIWKKLNFIRHGESDMVVFGVNEGLATEQEKKTADGLELAEENYFETNGLTTKGEGEHTWLGTEAIRKMNAEIGGWETVSLEVKEIANAFSVTEESLGDGTKKIKGTFTYMAEMISEGEVRVPFVRGGIADKKTGLVYPMRTYFLAETHVLEKDGEEFSILVSSEQMEEVTDDGNIRAEISYMLICPEDYEDAVFFLTGRTEEDESAEAKAYNEAEVFSLNDMNHGESDLVFFR